MPLLKYVSMAPVVKGPWMGVIKAVLMELTLRLKNGSRCIITGDAINSICDVTDQRDDSSTYYCADFYPGQETSSVVALYTVQEAGGGITTILWRVLAVRYVDGIHYFI